MTFDCRQTPFVQPDLYDRIQALSLETVNRLEAELEALSISLSDDRKETIYELIRDSIVAEVLE